MLEVVLIALLVAGIKSLAAVIGYIVKTGAGVIKVRLAV